MRYRVAPRTIGRMSTPGREIVVAISGNGSDLRGTVRVADAPEQSFTGWLGLLSALQGAVEDVDGAGVKA